MQLERITRSEAKARGLKRYFTGRPCKYGHVVERKLYGACVECVKINQKKYYMAHRQERTSDQVWREVNNKRTKEYYWRHRTKVLMQKKNRRAEQRDEINKKQRECYVRHREKRLVYHARYRAERRDEINKKKKEDYLRHREKRLIYYARSRAERRDEINKKQRLRSKKITDLLAVLHTEMPDLLKEFGL